ncbi:GNAT family N-acetyltransferase [Dictyobacter aurantiacus]|uniref:N-acetyltransferase domain-containing protein n=1 Tax=Dictyobacter aurantiacus TaxID=1936993 RepID=A0A401ZEN9_9CHLR|nr:GNAT family N-acetyltransferase [Dictyobacter aurantiacus]GCE05309.1 hypothetical protein KDAU_26380 [Dictyobacter aurantiacus]
MSQIEIRPAQAGDREPVLAFCANTWDWGDYIEQIWDEWMDNPSGQLLVATVDGQPVGAVHIQMLTETESWLEGLRVHPDYRRQGLARALNEAAMVEAMRRNATTIRLATDSRNIASIELSESMHMRRVGDFSLYTAHPFTTLPRAPQQPIRLATPEDLDMIIDYLNASNIFPLVGGLYYVKFQALPITAELLDEKIDKQQIYLLQRWERLDGLAIAEPRQEYQQQRLSVGYLDGTTIEAISFIAYDLRRRLSELQLEQVRVYAPETLLIHDAFDGVEYEAEHAIFYTYERSLV